MSPLRVARPGEPVQLIDLGPASGRIHGYARGATIAGSLVVGLSERHKANAAQREYKARQRELFPATTPERRAQMAAYKASRK